MKLCEPLGILPGAGVTVNARGNVHLQCTTTKQTSGLEARTGAGGREVSGLSARSVFAMRLCLCITHMREVLRTHNDM